MGGRVQGEVGARVIFDDDDDYFKEIIGVSVDARMRERQRERVEVNRPMVRGIPLVKARPVTIALSCEGGAGETKPVQVVLYDLFRAESFHATDFSASYAAVDGEYCGFYANLPVGPVEGARLDLPAQAEYQLVEEARKDQLSEEAIDAIERRLADGAATLADVECLIGEIRAARAIRKSLRVRIAPPPGSLTDITGMFVGAAMQMAFAKPVPTSAFTAWTEMQPSVFQPGLPVTMSVHFRAAARWVGVFHGKMLC